MTTHTEHPELTALLDEMTRLGYASARVEFSGGGDEGGADEIRLYRCGGDDGEDCPLYGGKGSLSQMLSDLPHQRYGSFADDGNFHVSGTIHVDVAERKVTMDATEYVSMPCDISEDLFA